MLPPEGTHLSTTAAELQDEILTAVVLVEKTNYLRGGLHSGGLQSGGLQSRATDFGSGDPLACL